MSIDYLIKIFSTEEGQTRGFAILLILCILCLTLDIIVVGMRCQKIFSTGDDCGVGYGYFGIAAMCIAAGVFSVWGLHRAWRAGHLENFRFF